jgi:hypothetical protein
MIELWVTQRPARSFLAVSALVGGFAIAVPLLQQSGFALATALFSISLAALVGTGKLASP